MRGDQPGAVLRRLSGPGLIAADGKTALTPAEHAELLANGWSLVVFLVSARREPRARYVGCPALNRRFAAKAGIAARRSAFCPR
jgi:hypothetical protein